MTYEEAIKHFQSLQKRYTTEHNGKMCEKVALALEAMEKQVPKKPKWIYGKDMGIAKCSICGKELHYYMNGCPECLNAIDWSADE